MKMDNYGIVVFIIGVLLSILTILGVLLFNNPPKEINPWYGYRTSKSMKSKANWDFANKLAGKIIIRNSALLTPICFGIFFLSNSMFHKNINAIKYAFFICLGIIYISFLLLYIEVESKIKNK